MIDIPYYDEHHNRMMASKVLQDGDVSGSSFRVLSWKVDANSNVNFAFPQIGDIAFFYNEAIYDENTVTVTCTGGGTTFLYWYFCNPNNIGFDTAGGSVSYPNNGFAFGSGGNVSIVFRSYKWVIGGSGSIRYSGETYMMVIRIA